MPHVFILTAGINTSEVDSAEFRGVFASSDAAKEAVPEGAIRKQWDCPDWSGTDAFGWHAVAAPKNGSYVSSYSIDRHTV